MKQENVNFMGKTVKIGVIGCGAISERLHVPDFHVCPQADVVAFCDVDRERAQALAGTFSPGAEIYTDYNELLKDPRVEAVTVCLPNVLHGPVTKAAAEAGKHIFVEKPMATSLAEAREMVEVAKRHNVLLMVNQTQRRYAAHIKAKEVLDSGLLGRVLYVIGMFGHAGPDDWSPGSDWFFHKDEASFGAMADLGIHKADIMRYLTGSEIVEIGAFSELIEKPDADVEDNFASCVKFDNGAIGMLGASWTAKGLGSNFLIFHCANGTLRVDMWPGQPCVAHLVNPSSTIIFDIPPPLNDYPDTWGVDVGGAFARAVLGMEEPFCTGEEGLKSLAVIMAAQEAARTKSTVKVQI